MSLTPSIVFGSPFSQESRGEQTNRSVGLRITGLAIGTLAVALGLHRLRTLPHPAWSGWRVLSAGSLLALASAVTKEITRPASPSGSARQEETFEEPNPAAQKPAPPTPQLGVFVMKKVAGQGPLPEAFARLSPPDLPWIEFKQSGLSIEQCKAHCTAPLTWVSDSSSCKRTVGLFVRLKVQHAVHDEGAYKRDPNEELYTPKASLASSQKPFELDALIWKRRYDDDLWILTSDESGWVEHRGAPYRTSQILGDARFWCHSDNLPDASTCDTLSGITSQNEVQEKGCYSGLEWILLRVFKKESLEIREFRTDTILAFHKKPSIGCWKIRLATSG